MPSASSQSHKTRPYGPEAEGGVAEISGDDPPVRGVVLPGAAPKNPFRTLPALIRIPIVGTPAFCTNRVNTMRPVVQRIFGVILSSVIKLIPTPLRDTSAHVIQPITIGLFLSHRVGLTTGVIAMPAHLVRAI